MSDAKKTSGNTHKYVLFDFDGTLVSKMQIDYNKMKDELKKLLEINESEDLTPMFDKINQKTLNNKNLRIKCFELIDQYELHAINQCTVNKNVLKMYLNTKHKIIITRNGKSVVEHFLTHLNIPFPEVLACRDNVNNLKPNLDHIDPIKKKYHNFGDNAKNILVVGDSWHDQELAKKIGCDFLQV